MKQGHFVPVLLFVVFLVTYTDAAKKKRSAPSENLQSNWNMLMHRLNERVLGMDFTTLPASSNFAPNDLAARLAGMGLTHHEWWVHSDSVAQALALEPLKRFEIPINVNVLFAGFDGDDGLGVRVDEATMRPWLEQVHGVSPHVTSLTSSATPISPADSEVFYKFKFHVHEMSPTADSVIFSVINRNLRPASPDQNASHQVDVTSMGVALDSLATHLNLSRSYSLFVLNPNTNTFTASKYGYRFGLSQAELDTPTVRASAGAHIRKWAASKMGVQEGMLTDALGSVDEALVDVSVNDWFEGERAVDVDKVMWRNVKNESEVWATQYAQTEDIKTASQVLGQMLRRESRELVEYARNVAAENVPIDEDCLADLYVNTGRIAWIDLGAEPSTWGPVVGGENVKSPLSLPRLKDLAKLTTVFSEKIGEASGESSAPSKTTLESEKQLLSEVVERLCSGFSVSNPELCKDMKQRIQNLERYLRTMDAPGRSRSDAPPPEPPIDIQATSALTSDPSVEISNSSLAQDTFLSNFGAFFDQTLHHLIAPASAALRPQIPDKVNFNVYIVSNHELFDPDDPANFNFGSFREEISRLKLQDQEFSFKLHKILLEDDPAVAMAYFSSLRTAAVPTLMVDGSFISSKRIYIDSMSLVQQLEFVSEEKLRTSHMSQAGEALPTKPKRGEKRNPDLSTPFSIHESSGTLQVPIFLFSLDENLPVFIDKYFQARAVKDMVIAVQSPETRWDSHMTCNGKHIRWNLRNPLRALVMATAQVISGLLPAHVTYSSHHHRTAQNWLWSVGRSPLSFTSYGHHFSQLQIDIARRNQIVGMVHDSQLQVRKGLAFLLAEKPTKGNFAVYDDLPLESLHASMTRLKVLYERIERALGQLNFVEAAKDTKLASTEAYQFHDLCLTVVGMLEMVRCDDLVVHKPLDKTYLFLPAVALVLFLLYFTLRTKQKHVTKIN